MCKVVGRGAAPNYWWKLECDVTTEGHLGRHEAVLNGGHLASGVYLVRLEAEGVVHASQKVLLLR